MECIDRHLSLALTRAWPLLERLVAALAAKTGGVNGEIPHALRLHVLRLLRPAEALLRRIIVLMAHEIESLPAPVPAAPPPGGRPTLRRVGQPGFQLFEKVPGFASVFGPTFASPRIGANPRILDLDAPYPMPTAKADRGRRPDRLIVRVRALQAALARRAKIARRLARYWARQKARPAGPARTGPLRPGWPPGSRDRQTPDWLKDVLLHIASEIRRCPDKTVDLTGTRSRLPGFHAAANLP
jgi:hypothetical protein